MNISKSAVTTLRVAAWVLAIGLALFTAWAYRYTMSPDGIAYLDLSDSYVHGAWSGAVNGYWSPLFPMVIAAVRRVIGTAAEHDFLSARIALFVAYILGLLATDALIRAILDARTHAAGVRPSVAERMTWWTLGYTLFIGASIPLMPEELVTPDRYVLVFLFFAAAAALRIVTRRASVAVAIWLGVALGLGYLSKAAMFPVSLVLLATVAVVLVRQRASLRNLIIAVVAFACIAVPQVVAVSHVVGHASIGEVSRLVFAWYVDRTPCPLWAADQECMGSPNGAVRATTMVPQPFHALTTDPHVFSFADHARGTFPPWYDASAWYRDLDTSLPIRHMIFVFATDLGKYWRFILPFLIALGAAVVAVRATSQRPLRDVLQDIRIEPTFVVTALVALVMYALVWTEPRYFGVFVVLAVLGVAARSKDWVVAALTVSAVIAVVGALTVSARDAWWRRGEGHEQFDEARAVTALGATPGSRVAVIGDAYHAYWARLARVQVIGDVHQIEATRFWCGDDATRQRVLDAFASLEARVVVATQTDPCANLAQWHAIGPGVYARTLAPLSVSAESVPR